MGKGGERKRDGTRSCRNGTRICMIKGRVIEWENI